MAIISGRSATEPLCCMHQCAMIMGDVHVLLTLSVAIALQSWVRDIEDGRQSYTDLHALLPLLHTLWTHRCIVKALFLVW